MGAGAPLAPSPPMSHAQRWTTRSMTKGARLPSMCDHADRLQRGAIAGGIGVRAGSEAGATRCGDLPAARMAGRLPTRTPANLGANCTSGRFVGARWSICASHCDVDGRTRTAGRAIDRSTAGSLRACLVARRCWEAGRWISWFVQVSGLAARPSGCLARWVEDEWAMWCAPLAALLWVAYWMS
jgi:hypothetical protein